MIKTFSFYFLIRLSFVRFWLKWSLGECIFDVLYAGKLNPYSIFWIFICIQTATWAFWLLSSTLSRIFALNNDFNHVLNSLFGRNQGLNLIPADRTKQIFVLFFCSSYNSPTLSVFMACFIKGCVTIFTKIR